MYKPNSCPVDGVHFRVLRVQGDVDQVVEAGEQADLGELAHPGKEAETDVRVGELHGRIQAAQKVAVGAGDLGRVEPVEDRLVVLVHEDRHALAGTLVELLDQVPEAEGRIVVAGGYLRFVLHDAQLRRHFRPHVFGRLVLAAAEVEANDRMACRPVPVLVDVQPLEERFVALEQLLAGVEEQALAEAPGPRQEVVLALVEQPPDVRGLVDVVAVLLADLAEGLDAYGESAFGHGCQLMSLKLLGAVTFSNAGD